MEYSKTKITIVVTVYNKERYIRQCLKSVFGQTDGNYKVVIIDDGSTDNSMKICKQYDRRRNCQVVSEKHEGTSAARNKGLKLVNTEYVFFVDGDDTIASDSIEKLNSVINTFPDLVVFGINYALKNGKVIFNDKLPIQYFSNKNDMNKQLVDLWDSNLMNSSCNKLFSLKIINDNNLCFKNKDFGEDLTFVCDYVKHCKTALTLKECFYTYREHTIDSQSKRYRNNFFQIWKALFADLERFFGEMDLLDKKTKEFISRRYIERVVGCIENEASLWNRQSVKRKYKKVYSIVNDKTVQESVLVAKPRSKKMTVLSWLLKHKMARTLFLFGIEISVIRNVFPRVFITLKMHR